MINIGVIGCGQWGPNHIRNFSLLQGCRVLMCSDLNVQRIQAMTGSYPGILTTEDYKNVLANDEINAVVIATPSATHFKLVKESLLSGKDVLCEKPLCLKVNEAEELIKISDKKKRILMVGHVFNYNSGIQNLRSLIQSGECGRMYYLHSERTNLGPFRTDVNAVWDLACHDVYIFNYLLNAMPLEVTARGGRFLQKRIEDVAFMSLVYPKNILVNIHVSWLDPRKVRQITAVGDKKMVIWDDLENVGPIKIYDRRVVQHHYYQTFGEFTLLAKEGDITIPKIALSEPLKLQDMHFLECIQKRCQPVTNGKTALNTIRVLMAIQKSLAKKGAPIKVS